MREAARKLVRVNALDTDLVGGFQSACDSGRNVVIPAHAESHIQDQGWVEGARVVARRADGFLCAAPVEAAAGVRAAVDAKGAGVEDLRSLEAESIGKVILLTDAGVHLDVKGVGILFAHLVEDIVWRAVHVTRRAECSSRDIGTADKAK